MALKYCPICGFKLYPESNFCSNCGEALNKYSEASEAVQPAELPTSIDEKEVDEEEPLPLEEQVVANEETPLPEDINDDFVQKNVDSQQELNQPQEIDDDILIDSEDELLNDDNESDVEECLGDDEPEDLSELEEETEIESQSIITAESEVIIRDTPIISASIDLSVNKEKDSDIQQSSQEQEEKRIKILGIPEWAFYSALIIIGICIVVFMKIQAVGDSTTEENDSTAVVVEQNDTIKKDAIDSVKVATLVKENKSTNNVKKDSAISNISAKIEMPKQSGTDLDSAYHVIITTVSDGDKASEVAKTSSYKGAYVVNNGSKYSVAVYRSLKKEEAKLYMDSVVKKDIPDAWLYHGVVK